MLVAVFVTATSSVAEAQGIGDLYQAMTIITGTDMRSRPTGFAQCLREVLVKVSGEPRLLGDPRVEELATHADALVRSFTYVDPRAAIRPHDDQGTYDRSQDFTVRFDPAAVDKALAALGEQPWRGERPAVVPVILVRGFAPPWTGVYLLTAEEMAGVAQRASFANSAIKYGIRVRVPTAGEISAWGISVDRFPSQPAAASSTEVPVSGTLEFQPAALGWVGSWRMRWHDTDYSWGVSGVGFDEAFDDLVRGTMRIVSGHGSPE
ncbi:MAG TPA: DUF2066 domain-containing protein [Stellaceae bacterium]|nr:DUF2066 domain-containing protein [Stellaceae bacterium]